MNERLVSKIVPLSIPFPKDETADWKSYPVFCGAAGGVQELECHVSVLDPNCCPHAPHAHPEEELLLLLSGEVELILPGNSAMGEKKMRLESGQFVYYPAGFSHSLRTTSESSANYLMFKWSGQPKNRDSVLGFDLFSLPYQESQEEGREGFHPCFVFEGPTVYLDKLHCHFSTLSPGAGYDPHSDPYDVAIIVLEGEVDTLGQRVEPHGVIFCAAGDAHGLTNLGEKSARYVVFEFHGGMSHRLADPLGLSLSSLFRLSNPRRWIKKFRNFVRSKKGD